MPSRSKKVTHYFTTTVEKSPEWFTKTYPVPDWSLSPLLLTKKEVRARLKLANKRVKPSEY